MDKNKDLYIFFLINSSQQWPLFLEFAQAINEYGIKVVPIKHEEMMTLDLTQKRFFISVANNVESAKNVKKLRKRFLDFCLKSRKAFLFDISSFSLFDKPFDLVRIDVYKKYALPMSMKVLVESIVEEYVDRAQDKLTWPGGRRAKLPA